MNPLIRTLATTIEQERTMSTTTADDRREGYCDGLSQHWQAGRSAAYNAANHDARCDAARMPANAPSEALGGWERVVRWLRACLS